MQGSGLFANYYGEKFAGQTEDMVVVSPDVGSVARARAFAQKMHMNLAIVDKRRPKANVSEVMNIIGDVKGKSCILLDDLVDTAGSLCNAANALVQIGGAKEVYACATHGVLSGPALTRIEESALKELVLLNTIPRPRVLQRQRHQVAGCVRAVRQRHPLYLRRRVHLDAVLMFFGRQSSAVEWIIAGLGNPGGKYEGTRHNVGFAVTYLLEDKLGLRCNRAKFHAMYGLGKYQGKAILLMRPQTYMNLSGEAVAQAGAVLQGAAGALPDPL